MFCLEGLDGVGKTSVLRGVANLLYDNFGKSTIIVSPTNVNKNLYKAISSKYSSSFAKFQHIMAEHSIVLDQAVELQRHYDYVLLDRSIYSAFAYCFYQDGHNINIDSHRAIALSILRSFEEQYNLFGVLMTVSESTRQRHLSQRANHSLYDSLSSSDSSLISNQYDWLIKHTYLKNNLSTTLLDTVPDTLPLTSARLLAYLRSV